MTSTCRILIASRNAGVAWNSHQELERSGNWHVVGIVDPRAKNAFHKGCEAADVVLIESEDLIWLLNHRQIETRTAFKNSPPVVLLDEGDILEIVTRGERTWGLLMQQRFADMSVDRLALATNGYLVITNTLLEQLRGDELRIEIVRDLSQEEISVLFFLGAALSNRGIAETSGMSESRVKATSRILARKLRLKNRTALAVFAVENEALLSKMAAKRSKSLRLSKRIGRNDEAKG
tara:strand:- start:70306 stop:71010 length:705 start_codon:yes stop_codon:yes gene_type:complete